ncbi:MAG TPA: hypothetical protein PKD42_12105 [Chitinophagaceae bacterium]|jgi:hypothetical protein|nr:hypothetical protein [Chitinophagaceae bacterium]
MNKSAFNFVVITTLVFITKLTFGQTNKVYNGNFNSKNFKGIANYSYFDKDDERVYDGTFSFKSQSNNFSISGNYKDGKKNGLWKVSLINVLNSDLLFKANITATVSGQFSNGNLSGQWTLERTKLLSAANNGISNYYRNQLNTLSYLFDGKQVDFNKTAKVTESAKANFKDNHFYGSFTHSVNNGKSTVTGQFNEDGFMDGVWTVNYYSDGILHLITKTYRNGVLMTIKEKDNSTGATKITYDKTFEVNEYFQKLNNENEGVLINDKIYTLKSVENFDKDFVGNALAVWVNNTSLSTSAYNFEIFTGTNKLAKFPEREIVYDDKKTEEYEEKLEQEKREKEELAELKRRQEDNERRERERKQREFEYSDYGRLQSDVKKEFNVWLTKSDFETATDFETRIKTQADSKYLEILKQKIDNSKSKSISKYHNAKIGDYNSEKELLSLVYNKTDTLFITMPKQVAQEFVASFKQVDDYGNSKIFIYPIQTKMVNNYWRPTEAIIVFNNYWWGSSYGIGAEKVYETNGRYYYDREENDYNLMKKVPKPYEMTNINTIQGGSSIPRLVFYHPITLNQNTNEQTLNFTPADLKITIQK